MPAFVLAGTGRDLEEVLEPEPEPVRRVPDAALCRRRAAARCRTAGLVCPVFPPGDFDVASPVEVWPPVLVVVAVVEPSATSVGIVATPTGPASVELEWEPPESPQPLRAPSASAAVRAISRVDPMGPI
jgi:hypothetical protein